MMHTITATFRSKEHVGKSNKLRAKGIIPSVLYDVKGGPSQNLQVVQQEMAKLVKEIGVAYLPNTVLNLSLEGKLIRVLVVSMEYSKTSYDILHVDFIPLYDNKKVVVRVPLSAINIRPDECPGVKFGGAVNYNVKGVLCYCLPAHIPKTISVDMRGVLLDRCVYIDKVIVPPEVKIIRLPADCAMVSIVKCGV